ncbi:MAG: type II toxin-antitoxin system HicA family toxin [Candidatus Bathyarchaeota archaeon]|nr:type II toxin-antitoxin system HicA family toxin [Candidatus Bathyarchaeota archaeon]
MTKLEKLVSRFLTRPKDFTYSELRRMLNGFGYNEIQGSVSRVVFSNASLKHRIKLQKPHPGNILKTYQIDLVLNELKSNGLL